jgi:SAM-dependent methyltransferase
MPAFRARDVLLRYVIAPLRGLKRKRSIRMRARRGELFKVHYGCGDEYIDGYLNIDSSATSQADIVASNLNFFPQGSIAVIESYHVFEHFDLLESQDTLKRWHALLCPGGELLLELPNLAVCIAEIGKHFNDEGYDLAMAGIFSYPPLVRQFGEPMIHKWGWTPETLTSALYAAGFSQVQQRPVKQNWRSGTEFDRDMQIVGIK